MSYAINADNVDAIEQSLEGGGPSARASSLSAATGAAGDLAGSSARLEAQVSSTTGALAFQTGTNGPDTLLGGDGTDLIDGRGGDDTAAGGGGGDLVFGGSGDDSLAGDGGFAPVGFPFPPNGDDTIVGGAGNDTIYGDSFFYNGLNGSSNLLFGGAGDDRIIAGYGSDTVSGGSGDDFIRGYGADLGRGSGGEGAVRADLGDLLFGGAGRDTIDGGGGNDTIDGGAGDDRLVGGFGVDALTGGPGTDRFVFGFSSVFMAPDTGRGDGNRDVVTDFESGADLLDLSGYRNTSVTWAYDAAGDRTIVSIVDPRSAVSSSFGPYEIELAGVQNLTADDIVLV